MKISEQLGGLVTLAFLVTPVWSQSPAPARRTPRQPTQILVRDMSGSPLADVKITVSGAAAADATTNAEGSAPIVLASGTYRLRFEHEGFITLERDVTVGAVRPREIAVSLNRAPAPPPAPAAPAPPAAPQPVATAGRSMPPTNTSITAFLDKNFVGREGLKESVLGCMPDATARLLQLREPMAAHTHDDVDEVLYVVAGEGALSIGERSLALTPGSLSTIPRGTAHALERKGRNPLIVLSTLAGEPCAEASVPAGNR
jgi:mannose-6-phosphate isomerase-like protein (cupin superfamily)